MTKDVIDSVIEAQAIALSAKNEEIKELEKRLRTAGEQIESLQTKVDSGLFQNMIDQIMEDAVAALDDALIGRQVDYLAEFARAGDVMNVPGESGEFRPIQLRTIVSSGDVVIQSTAMSRQLKNQVTKIVQTLIDSISSAECGRLVFRRLPRPFPGTGAVCASVDNKYGLRVIVSYNPNTLSTHLHLDVLCGEVPA